MLLFGFVMKEVAQITHDYLYILFAIKRHSKDQLK